MTEREDQHTCTNHLGSYLPAKQINKKRKIRKWSKGIQSIMATPTSKCLEIGNKQENSNPV